MEEHVGLGLADIVVGLVLVGVCLPLMYEKIPPNCFFGFRIPQAFRTQKSWYDINRFGARQMIWWTVPLYVTGILKMVLPWDEWVMSDFVGYLVIAGPALTCALVPAVLTILYAMRYDKQQ